MIAKISWYCIYQNTAEEETALEFNMAKEDAILYSSWLEDGI